MVSRQTGDSGTVTPNAQLVPKLIRASAGTGKTFQLSNRLLHLFFADQEPDSVLASTFTRKAAGEILGRVLQRLAKAVEDPTELERMSLQMQPFSLSKAQCQRILKSLTSQIHRLRISTLDSFFSQLGRSFAHDIGLPNGWQLLDQSLERGLRRQAIQMLLDQESDRSIQTLVHLMGKGEYPAGVFREIERTITDCYEVFQKTSASAWEGLVIPEAPSGEVLEKAAARIEAVDLRHKNIVAAQKKLSAFVAERNWEGFISHPNGLLLAAYSDNPKYYGREIPKEVSSDLWLIGNAVAAHLLPVYRNQTKATWDLLELFDKHFERLKRARRCWTFSDIARRLAHWLGPKLASEDLDDRMKSVAFRLDSNLRHLLLDEFQDTSPLQWEVIRPFALDVTSQPQSVPTSFFCVGDTKQAIYGWRGGVAAIFDEVRDSIAHLEEGTLQESRRSSPVVIDTVNQVFTNLTQHDFGSSADAVDAWQIRYPVHSTHHRELAGYAILKNGISRTQTTYERDNDGSESDTSDVDDEDINDIDRIQVELVADDIEALAKASPSSSIGVLVRTNSQVGICIDALRKRKLDVSQEGGNPLTDSAAVENILSLITLADHPGNTVVQFHLQNSPLSGMFESNSQGSSEQLAGKLRWQLHLDGLGKFVAAYAERLAPACDERDRIRLEQLVQLAYRFEPEYQGRWQEFVEFVRNERVSLPQPAQIRVMNVHQSKGLEFDAVFLPLTYVPLRGRPPMLVERRARPTSRPEGVLRYISSKLHYLLPKPWQAAFQAEADGRLIEQLCLLYVAMTRARQALYMYTFTAGKSQGQNVGSLLQTTLDSSGKIQEPHAVLYEAGNAEWYLSGHLSTSTMPNKPTNRQKLTNKIRTATEKRSGQAASTNARTNVLLGDSTSWESPSSNRSKATESLASAFRYDEQTSVLEGLIVHRWLESIRWFDEKLIDSSRLTKIASQSFSPRQLAVIEIPSLIQEFRSWIACEEIKLVLSPPKGDQFFHGCETISVDTERRIAVVEEGRLLQGSMDRVVIGETNGAVITANIIDFKTDEPDSNLPIERWLSERVEFHAPQLDSYCRMLRQSERQLQRIRSTLVFLKAGRVVTQNR